MKIVMQVHPEWKLEHIRISEYFRLKEYSLHDNTIIFIISNPTNSKELMGNLLFKPNESQNELFIEEESDDKWIPTSILIPLRLENYAFDEHFKYEVFA